MFVVMQTGNQANGGVESITQIIENLQTISPIIITQLETPTNARWRSAGAEVHVWDMPFQVGSSFYRSSWRSKWQRLKSWLRTNHRAYCILRETSAQIVHCNDGWALWQTAFGARLAGSKVIYNIRGMKPPSHQYGWHWQLYIRLAHHLLVLSEEMRCELLSAFSYLRRHPSRISSIYSIVEFKNTSSPSPQSETQLPSRLGVNEEEVKIGYIGVVRPIKGQLEFIKNILAPLSQLLEPVQIFFVGDFTPDKDEYAQSCKLAVDRLGLSDSTEFVGFTSLIEEWYHVLDIVVVGSHYEGLARCMIESIACGTPVVSFNVTSAREILEGYHCGVVVPQGDYDSLLKAIVKLAGDPAKRQQMGENGRRTAVQLFNAKRVTAQYEALYRSFLSMR